MSSPGETSMRILHVANFSTHKYGADLYATDRKISAGLIRNGHFVYDFSYRDVCRSESFFRTTKLGTAKVNEKLLHACDTLVPHVLLLGHSELIEAATLEIVKQKYPEIKIALWYVDALFHREKTDHLYKRLGAIDVVFATTGGAYLQELRTDTTCSAFIPNMVDPAVESKKSFLRSSHDYDFIFCGRDSNEPERQSFMEKLQQETSSYLRCEFRGCLAHPPVTGYDYLDFLGRSKMGLNISRRNDVPLYTSDRLIQLLGNGLLTFCPQVPGMQKIFADNELVYFETQDELLEKISWFHSHPEQCRKTAEKGWNRVHQSYGAQRITSYMIELLFDIPFTSDYEWKEEIYK